MQICPKCGGKVIDNRCTECGELFDDSLESAPKKMFFTMPNGRFNFTLNRQYSIPDYAGDTNAPKKTIRSLLKQIGSLFLKAAALIIGIGLLGTILQLLEKFL